MASVSAVEVSGPATGRRATIWRSLRGELKGSEYTWALAFCVPYLGVFVALGQWEIAESKEQLIPSFPADLFHD